MSNTTCRRAVPPRGLKSRRISPSPPPPQTQAAFCAAAARSALLARSVRRSASRRLVIANGDQRPLAPKCHAALAAPCGHFASLVRSSSTARLPSENFVLLRRILRPVQHLPAHPAAPLGSRAAKRRPVSFAHESESQNAMQPARSFRARFTHTIRKELSRRI